MRVIARRTLIAYVGSLQGNSDQAAVKTSLDAWFAEANKANWANSAEVRQSYATASVVIASRVVFNIKGNDYRLIVEIHYAKGIVWVIWIGTHNEYNNIDVRGVQYNA